MLSHSWLCLEHSETVLLLPRVHVPKSGDSLLRLGYEQKWRQNLRCFQIDFKLLSVVPILARHTQKPALVGH